MWVSLRESWKSPSVFSSWCLCVYVSALGGYVYMFNLLNFPAGVVPVGKITAEEEAKDLEEYPTHDARHVRLREVSIHVGFGWSTAKFLNWKLFLLFAWYIHGQRIPQWICDQWKSLSSIWVESRWKQIFIQYLTSFFLDFCDSVVVGWTPHTYYSSKSHQDEMVTTKWVPTSTP